MKTLLMTVASCAALVAQDRITVPFSDAARPRMVQGSLLQGCFTVEGYDGKDVQIESRAGSAERRSHRIPAGAEGMKRIDPQGGAFTAEEENNTIRIRSGLGSGGHLHIRVPFNTSLKLECVNGGELQVDRVSGDLDLQNLNGGVTATNVSGSVLAHSLNGKVIVSLDKVTAGKPMSFSTLNGNLDVTLPPDVKATARMKSDNGEIYSDFEIVLTPNGSAPVVEDGRAKGGKYRVKVDRSTVGAINGGGPDLIFKTLNGNIYIHKKK